MTKVRKAVIPVAGMGTRFLPVTKSVPKELLPIGTKPTLQIVVEEAVSSGVEEIILVSSPDKKQIEEFFSKRPPTTGSWRRRVKRLCCQGYIHFSQK